MELAKENMNLDPPSSTDVIELETSLIKRILKGRGYTPRLRWFLIGTVFMLALYTAFFYAVTYFYNPDPGPETVPIPTEANQITF